MAAVEPVQAEQAPLVIVAETTDLDSLLRQAGLELVQTDAASVQYSAEPVAPQPQHPPRERKPRFVVDEEPLQLVETQQ